MLNERIIEKFIGAYDKVYNTLGNGFLEKVDENTMGIELRKGGLKVKGKIFHSFIRTRF